MPRSSRRQHNEPEAGLGSSGLPLAPPGGMRDLLPPASTSRTQLWQQLMETFELHGYQRVTTPPFEYAEVIGRGLETVSSGDLIRFIEPETGEVALLRPDITPQIARIVATRLQERPAPWRLCYEGTVVRRKRGRARKQQQILQCGIECVGLKAPAGDAEVIEVALRACERVGLESFVVELAQVRIGSAALGEVAPAARGAIIDALSAKDDARLADVLKKAKAPAAARKRIRALGELYGDASVLGAARRRFRDSATAKAIGELERVVDALDKAGFGERIAIDLGELRRQSYYTGVSVTLIADGPGEPVGMGGRYDQLLGRYDAPAPATGFAFDVDNLAWALRRAGVSPNGGLPLRVLVAGGSARSRRALADSLRRVGVRAATLAESNARAARAYAEAWSFDGVAVLDKGRARTTRIADGRSKQLSTDAAPELAEWLRKDR